MSRIPELLNFIKEDPTDPFPRYALALEYLKTDPQVARQAFDALVKDFPTYLPTYYPAAQLLIDLGETAEAEQMFNAGIKLAQSAGERKAEAELRQAKTEWEMERG